MNKPDEILQARIIYTKGMRAACELILGELPSMDPEHRQVIALRHAAYDGLIAELEEIAGD